MPSTYHWTFSWAVGDEFELCGAISTLSTDRSGESTYHKVVVRTTDDKSKHDQEVNTARSSRQTGSDSNSKTSSAQPAIRVNRF